MPDEIVAVAGKITQGNLAGALDDWKRLYPVIDAMFGVPFIPAVKAGLGLQGLPVGVPRKPTAPLSDEQTDVLRTALCSLVPEVV